MLLSKRTADNDESCDEERKERENYRGGKVCYIYSAMLGVQSETGSLCGVQQKESRSKAFHHKYSRCALSGRVTKISQK